MGSETTQANATAKTIMRDSLFRQQALDHQRPTLIGNTLAVETRSFKVMTAVAVGLAIIAVLFGCFVAWKT